MHAARLGRPARIAKVGGGWKVFYAERSDRVNFADSNFRQERKHPGNDLDWTPERVEWG